MFDVCNKNWTSELYFFVGGVGGGGRFRIVYLKGLSHEIDFDNVDENLQMLALTRAAAGF
jgi:hypothetical protein